MLKLQVVVAAGILRALPALLKLRNQFRKFPTRQQIARRLRNRNTPILHKFYGLKLELAAELPFLHSNSPVPLNTLSRCPRNRQQAKQSICKLGENAGIIATRAGTVATTTLALALRSVGARTEQHDGFLEITVEDGFEAVERFLEELSNGDTPDLFASNPALHFEKFHPYLNDELLKLDALSTRLQESGLSEICEEIIQ